MWKLGWRVVRSARLGLAVRTLPCRAVRMALPQPMLAMHPLSTSCVLAKKKGGKHTEKNSHAVAPEEVEAQLDLDEIDKHMSSSVARCRESVQTFIGSLGRIDPSLLDDVRVAAGKGAKPAALNNYATVGVRDNVLLVTAYEPSTLKHIEKAIYAANKDLTPEPAPEEGEGVLYVHVPKATGETRKALVQKCVSECEHAKAAVRSARQAAQKRLKHDTDAKLLSKNESQKEAKRLEDITKKYSSQIEQVSADAHKRLLH